MDDCGAGEDEMDDLCTNYHRVTLEDGLLGWFTQGQDGVDDDTNWLLGTGATASIGNPLLIHLSSDTRTL